MNATTDTDFNQDLPAEPLESGPPPNGLRHTEPTDPDEELDADEFVRGRDEQDEELLAKLKREVDAIDFRRSKKVAVIDRLTLALGHRKTAATPAIAPPSTVAAGLLAAHIMSPKRRARAPKHEGPRESLAAINAEVAKAGIKGKRGRKPKAGKLSQTDQVLAYLESHPKSSNAQIAKGVGLKSVSALTNRLKRTKAIKKHDTDEGVVWSIA
jgi:hypothetical protein